MNESRDRMRSRLDGFAVLLSGTCLLHCLALPLLVVSVPVLQGSALMDEQLFHLVMLLFIVPTSAIALAWGCRKHKDPLTIALGCVGLAILTLTALFGHDWFGQVGERLVTSAGGIVLAIGHIRNFLICRRDDCTHGEDAPH